MIELKNIFDDVVSEIRGMSKQDFINEMTNEGCIYLGRIDDNELQFELPVRYENKDKSLPILENMKSIETGYSEYEGALAA